MEKINEILKDNSLNDKLLIKELSLYIKNHKLKNKKIDGKFVKDVVGIIASNEEGIINNIRCVDDGYFLGCYFEKEMEINLTAINNLRYDYPNLNMEVMSYFLVLEVILHEMTHAKQHYLLENEKHELYDTAFEYVARYYENYEINHDITPTERYADARGIYIAYQVLSYIYPKEKLEYIKKYFFYTLTKEYDYVYDNRYIMFDDVIISEIDLDELLEEEPMEEECEFQSPIKQFNNILEETDISKIKIDPTELNLFERIYLGLDITSKEYEEFDPNEYSVLETKNKRFTKKLTKSKKI